MSPQSQRLLDANRQFYRAFESMNLEKMRAVWWPGEEVTCVHPGWPLLSGQHEVMRSWTLIFDASRHTEFELTNVSAQENGAMGWVLCQENILSHAGGQTSRASVPGANVFTLRDERWLMMHHHGSRIMRDAPPPELTTPALVDFAFHSQLSSTELGRLEAPLPRCFLPDTCLL